MIFERSRLLSRTLTGYKMGEAHDAMEPAAKHRKLGTNQNDDNETMPKKKGSRNSSHVFPHFEAERRRITNGASKKKCVLEPPCVPCDPLLR